MKNREALCHGDARRRGAGFTRADLCAAVAMVSLLGALLLPAVAGTARGTGGLVCQDNLRRLSAAWLTYAEDSGGKLAANSMTEGLNWVSGQLDWSSSPDNTNTATLLDRQKASLGSYVGTDPHVFRCSADRYLSPFQLGMGWLGRTRSYSMNGYFGVSSSGWGQAYQGYTKLSDLRALPPGRAFVFIEEHPDSIFRGVFVLDLNDPRWVGVPGALHAGKGWVSFADGHVDSRRWSHPLILAPVTYTFPPLQAVEPGDPDYAWLKGGASELR